MKIKTNELTGAALDWAVAKCEGVGEGSPRFIDIFKHQSLAGKGYCYSRAWSQGGPIIERERIDLYFIGHDAVDNGLPIWRAEKLGEWGEDGPTPLIAAMRCYVGSVIGNEVEVPDELAEGATA